MRRRPQLVARPQAVAAASTSSQVGELSGATAGATTGTPRSDWLCRAMEAVCTYEDWSSVVQEATNDAVDDIEKTSRQNHQRLITFLVQIVRKL